MLVTFASTCIVLNLAFSNVERFEWLDWRIPVDWLLESREIL